jgi:nicotinamide riboside kinase
MGMPKIAIVGPESSGKTTLCEELMMRVGGGHVSDGTREYLEELDRPYIEEDLLEMARSHAQWFVDAPLFASEHWAAIHGNDPVGKSTPLEPVYFDCDILNIKIWSQERFGRVHPEIDRLVRELKYDLRLLCRPDVPWEPDPLRENPRDRDRLFTIWEHELNAFGFPYVIIEGKHEDRVQKAVDVVEAMLRGSSS